MIKKTLIAVLLCICGAAVEVQAQVMKASDLEKYAKQRYGEKWLDAAANLAQGLSFDKKYKIEPLYGQQDVNKAMRHFVTYGYDRRFRIFDDVLLTFTNSGHMLGGAICSLEIYEEDKDPNGGSTVHHDERRPLGNQLDNGYVL